MAARRVLPPLLMTPAKASKPLHERQRTAGGAAAGELFHGAAKRRQIGARARTPLEQHAFGLGQRQNGFHRVLDGIDEAGRTLRGLVAGRAEFDAPELRIPVPVGGIGVRLQPVAADVEPHRRIKGRILVQQQVNELVVEHGGIFGRAEVSAADSPIADGFGDAADQLA